VRSGNGIHSARLYELGAGAVGLQDHRGARVDARAAGAREDVGDEPQQRAGAAADVEHCPRVGLQRGGDVERRAPDRGVEALLQPFALVARGPAVEALDVADHHLRPFSSAHSGSSYGGSRTTSARVRRWASATRSSRRLSNRSSAAAARMISSSVRALSRALVIGHPVPLDVH